VSAGGTATAADGALARCDLDVVAIGVSLVQDPGEAAHPVMPRRAIAEDHVGAVLPLDGIAATIVAMTQGRAVYGAQAEMRV
jgi:chemotaxis response regulator CheB